MNTSLWGAGWRTGLRDQLREAPEPLFVFDDTSIPAATLWVLIRQWTASVDAGHQLHARSSAESIAGAVASLWRGGLWQFTQAQRGKYYPPAGGLPSTHSVWGALRDQDGWTWSPESGRRAPSADSIRGAKSSVFAAREFVQLWSSLSGQRALRVPGSGRIYRDGKD